MDFSKIPSYSHIYSAFSNISNSEPGIQSENSHL